LLTQLIQLILCDLRLVEISQNLNLCANLFYFEVLPIYRIDGVSHFVRHEGVNQLEIAFLALVLFNFNFVGDVYDFKRNMIFLFYLEHLLRDFEINPFV
jgi:hypothetical protein